MTLALSLAWAGLVLGGLASWRRAPARARARALGGCSARERGPRASRLEVVGRLVLKAGPQGSGGRREARRAGAVVLATGAALAVAPPLALFPGAAAWAAARLGPRRQDRRRHQALEASVPEAVDLLALAVGAGCNVALAVEAAGRRATGPVAGELARVSAEVARGRRLADALDDLPERAGEALRPLAATLAGCERYGAPIVPALERLSDEVRRQRQRRAEEAARKVPVLLIFPLVVCILPAFALLTVAPLIAGALGQLRL